LDLHGIVSGAISAVNPRVNVTIQQSIGSATAASGKRTPAYSAPVTFSGQVQPLQYTDLMKLDGLNLTGIRKKLYIEGAYEAVARANGVGGDLVRLPDGSVWLLVFVFEQWPDWCSVCLTEQNNG
jgi:hypothetical protein